MEVSADFNPADSFRVGTVMFTWTRGHFTALKLLTCKMVGDSRGLLSGKQGVRKQNSFSAR